MPSPVPLQDLCELGSEQLIETRYLEAEATLSRAEEEAWAKRDWDTLARLYMPLQEARRQRRQRCGEGVVALDLVAQGPHDTVDGRRIVENFPHGQLLVAGWKSIEPAVQVRRLAAEHGLYVETFLGAVFPVGGKTAVVIVPLEEAQLPTGEFSTLAELEKQLPQHSLVAEPSAIVKGQRRGTPQTFGEVMALWERLHAPFLAVADAENDLLRQIERYRLTARVDYACELAHQKLSDAAHRLAREARIASRAT
jgi:hypothetical protein